MAAIAVAGVGLMMVCSSSVAAAMMMGGEEKEDPVVPKTPKTPVDPFPTSITDSQALRCGVSYSVCMER